MGRALSQVEVESKKAGLKINFGKTEKMRINNANQIAIVVGNAIIKRTGVFCNLGS